MAVIIGSAIAVLLVVLCVSVIKKCKSSSHSENEINFNLDNNVAYRIKPQEQSKYNFML